MKIDSLQALMVVALMLFLIWSTLKTYRDAPTAAQKRGLYARTVALCVVGVAVIIVMIVLVVVSSGT